MTLHQGFQLSLSQLTSYEYNYETGFPTRVINGEEFIYE